METRIWVRNGYRNINPEKAPRESRELDSFTFYNNAAKPFVKLGGSGWYKIHCNEEGHVKAMLFVTRTLADMSFEEWLEVALNNKFSGNIK